MRHGELNGEVGLPGPGRPVEDDLALVVEQLHDLVQDSPVDMKALGSGRDVVD